MKNITILFIVVVVGLVACSQSQAAPETIIETVEVEKIVTVEVEKEVVIEKVVTVEVEKEVPVVETVEVTRVVIQEVEVPVIQTVEIEKIIEVEVVVAPSPTPLPTPTATPMWENTAQQLILREITFVQDHGETQPFRFSCAGNGVYGAQDFASALSLEKDESIFTIPNAGNLDLWGETAGLKFYGDNTVELIPRSHNKFQDPRDGQFYESLSLDEVLDLATAGYVRWIGGQHGDAGHVAGCDPQYQTQ